MQAAGKSLQSFSCSDAVSDWGRFSSNYHKKSSYLHSWSFVHCQTRKNEKLCRSLVENSLVSSLSSKPWWCPRMASLSNSFWLKVMWHQRDISVTSCPPLRRVCPQWWAGGQTDMKLCVSSGAEQDECLSQKYFSLLPVCGSAGFFVLFVCLFVFYH